MYCAEPGCSTIVPRGRCAKHARALELERPHRAARRWYFTARWRALRRQVLEADPLCVLCRVLGLTTVAVDVDHKEPHNGDPITFWDPRNLQGLCKAHHVRKTRAGL
jgi:5-methylcytosine-specific restriction enzyme A